MTTINLKDYLVNDYLTDEYLAQNASASDGFQFEAKIDKLKAVAAQFQGVIEALTSFGLELEAHIADMLNGEGLQFSGNIESLHAEAIQFQSVIESLGSAAIQFQSEPGKQNGYSFQLQGIIDDLKSAGIQFQGVLDSNKALAAQFEGLISLTTPIGLQTQFIIDDSSPVGLQFESKPIGEVAVALQTLAAIQDYKKSLGLQFNSSEFFHRTGHYTVDNYLVGDYLVELIAVHLPLQFRAELTSLASFGLQFEGVLDKKKTTGLQFRGFIEDATGAGLQFVAVTLTSLSLQFKAALYNTDNLRILCEFPSRGNGTNWTASNTASGDYNVNNLNTDVVEQIWRTASTVVTGVTLTCDTGLNQGVFLDTLAILNHNMTTSANVVLIGSDSPTFATIGISITVPMTLINSYWIAPDLPNVGFRYWKFQIDDATNQNGFISIGTIVFGESIILQGECYSNPVRLKKTHYSDGVFTEGFTYVTNDRGIKRIIELDFKSLNFSGGNYANLQNIFDTARTNLKCLWIPTPKYPSRYAVFGKLSELPQEEHVDNGEQADYVSFGITVDESR